MPELRADEYKSNNLIVETEEGVRQVTKSDNTQSRYTTGNAICWTTGKHQENLVGDGVAYA